MKNGKKLGEAVKAYAVVNGEKNELAKQAKELNEEIKDLMGEAAINTFTVDNITATIIVKKGKKLNIEKVEKLLGYAIPADCFKDTFTEQLNIKVAAVAAKNKKAA